MTAIEELSIIFEFTDVVVRPLLLSGGIYNKLKTCFSITESGDILIVPEGFSNHSAAILALWYPTANEFTNTIFDMA
jgi:N-dimethylarginine dimethylaminohydrolase